MALGCGDHGRRCTYAPGVTPIVARSLTVTSLETVLLTQIDDWRAHGDQDAKQASDYHDTDAPAQDEAPEGRRHEQELRGDAHRQCDPGPPRASSRSSSATRRLPRK